MEIEHKPIAGPIAYSPEWYEIRTFNPDRKGREVVWGASEAAAACNQDPYSSALEKYLIKRGEFVKEFSDEQKRAMAMGTRLEPIILDVYEESQDCRLARRLPLYFHPTWSFMAATPDAIATKQLGTEEDAIDEWSVDAKATGWRMLDKSGDDNSKYGEPGTDQVPTGNLFQAQQQMAVMGFDRCDFPVLVDGRELRIYTVPRNDDLIQQIALAEAELSERIMRGDPPEPNWEHSGTKAVLNRMFANGTNTVAELTEVEHDLWTRREQLASAIKMMTEEKDDIENRIKWAVGENEIARFPDASIELKRVSVKATRVEAFEKKAYWFLKPRKIG